jgi:hypothetical protein
MVKLKKVSRMGPMDQRTLAASIVGCCALRSLALAFSSPRSFATPTTGIFSAEPGDGAFFF